MEDKVLLERIKRAVESIEPSARIFLYGSRARGEARPDSDWDLLVLVEGDVTPDRTSRIRRQLYEIEWETGEVLCAIVRDREQWRTPLARITPFWQSVNREAILL
jgi:uncharacterized protein